MVLAHIEEFVTGAPVLPEADRVLATTLFTDIVDSTPQAARVGDKRWRETLDAFDAIVARETVRFGGRLIKTTGDGSLSTFDAPTRAARCGCAIRDGARMIALEIRAGIHTGELELRGDDVSGMAVVIAERIMSLGGAGEILASSTVHDLAVGSGIDFTEWGSRELKGVPGSWQVFAVEPS